MINDPNWNLDNKYKFLNEKYAYSSWLLPVWIVQKLYFRVGRAKVWSHMDYTIFEVTFEIFYALSSLEFVYLIIF